MDRRAPSEASIAHVRALLDESLAVKRRVLEDCSPTIAAIGEALADTLERGGKLLLCGNGGSAADAQHLAGELLVRLRSDVDREPLPAIALTMDTSSMTGHGNDYGFESYYARMTRALGRPGDALLGITTSGRSANILRALEAARDVGMTTIGFLGGDGGPALALCDLALVVPSRSTGRVQESHIAAGHAAFEVLEESLLARGRLRRS